MADDKIHNRVRALLRKAENTPFEEEAATFFAAAQRMIVKYAIDQEALWANDPTKREEIHTEDVAIKDRQAGAHYRRQILHQIAINNNCRVWYAPGSNRTTVCGFPSDTLFVTMLYQSVMSHMNFRMADALARHTAEGRNTKTFRKSFTVGFSDSICERLRETKREQMRYLRENLTSTGESTELVIRDRSKKVDDWVEQHMKLRQDSYTDTGKRDSAAMGAGYMAGKSADLSGGRGGSVGGGRKAIGR